MLISHSFTRKYPLRLYLTLLVVTVLLLSSCTQIKHHLINRGKTCLVLSVGGPKGLAHAGAIDALIEKDIDIDCIYGNSMGAVIGGLYAHKPDADISKQIESTFANYVKQSKADAKSNALTGFIVGAGMAWLSGGTLGWETMLGSAGAGAFLTDKFDNKRFKKVFNKRFSSVNIEDLSIPYATSYFKKTASGVDFESVSTGNLALAISRSANNPFIFKNTSLSHIDPGLDRAASIPIDDAIKQFDPDVIIAINVTGTPAVFSGKRGCKVIEIMVEVDEPSQLDMENLQEVFNSYYKVGYDAIMAAL